MAYGPPVNYAVATPSPLTIMDEHLAGIDVALGAAGATNITWGAQTTTTAEIQSSNGTNATATSATALLAGLMSAADKTKLDLITVAAAVNLDTINTQQGNLITLSGVAANAADLGTFTGATVTDNVTVKAALQELETALEAITGSTDLTWTPSPTTGVVGSSTGNDATLTLVTAVNSGLMPPAEFTKTNFLTVTAATDLDAMLADVADLTTLTGVPSNSADLGTGFTGTTIPDGSTVTAALQALETAVEAVPTRIQTVVATIAARNAQAGVAAGDLTWVIDATGDPTITTGGGLYIHDGTAYVKVAEAESLDVTTNLTNTPSATEVTVESSSGTNTSVAGATNALAGVATAAQITNLESLIALTGVAADSLNYGALVTGDVVSDNATLLQALIDLEAGLGIVDVTQANLLAAANVINVTGKFAGKKARVTDRSNIIVFSQGAAAASAWSTSDGVYVASPV